MLLSVHFPITDARAFFPGALGQALQLHGSTYSEPFIRSTGGRARRLLGSDPVLRERHFYRINRDRPPIFAAQRVLSITGVKSTYARYYQLDEASGRLETCAVVRTNRRFRATLDQVFALIQGGTLQLDPKPKAETPLLGLASAFARYMQRQNRLHGVAGVGAEERLVFGGSPICFVEAKAAELDMRDTAYRVPIDLDGVTLHSAYVRRDVLAWIIVRHHDTPEVAENARMLRSYLSRIHCQVTTHLALLRRFPRICEAAGAEDVRPIVDHYTQYLTASRRFLRAEDERGHRELGRRFVLAAQRAIEIAEPRSAEALELIERTQRAYVTRANILRNILEDLNPAPDAAARHGLGNVVVNFGIQHTVHQEVAGIAASQIPAAALSDHLLELTRLIGAYGGRLSPSNHEAINTALDHMHITIRRSVVSGPPLLNQLDYVERHLRGLTVGYAEVGKVITRLRNQLLL